MDNTFSNVILIGLTDCGEKVCAAGGRISTQSGNAIDIWNKSQDDEKNTNLIGKVTKSGHNSVLEHTFYNFAFKNVSVVVEQFMIEFRLASFTVKSRRYVDFNDASYVTPEFSDESLTSMYKEHMNSFFEDYKYFLDNGVPKEDARFVLPYCFCSNFFCSMNGRELIHILDAMLNGRGKRYPEIYALGLEMLEQVKKVTPGIAETLNNAKNSNDTLNFDDIINSVEKHRTTQVVELLSGTSDGARCVAKSALISNTQLSSDDIDNIVNDAENRSEIIKRVIKSSRPRALESIQYSFRINHVSLAEVTHIVRHRLQSVMLPELTKSDRRSYIIPDSIKQDKNLLKRYNEAFERNAKLYEALSEKGLSEETLVYFLLSGNTLDVVTTMNGRELLLFLKLRTCERAQWEIRRHATEMLRILREKEPEIFKFYGPSCFVEGVCPEGRLTCGKFSEIQKKFK